MSCENESAAELRRAGYRLTPQRLMIVTTVRHAQRHMNASEILEVVKQTYPFVDASTVYRTLDVLKQRRVVSETDLGTGDRAYEWLQPKRHHHLICRECGGVTSVEHEPFEALRRAIEREHGFDPDVDHFAVFGVCRHCRGTVAVDKASAEGI